MRANVRIAASHEESPGVEEATTQKMARTAAMTTQKMTRTAAMARTQKMTMCRSSHMTQMNTRRVVELQKIILKSVSMVRAEDQ